MSVDLPAPLSPASASTSPGETLSETSFKRLDAAEADRDVFGFEDWRLERWAHAALTQLVFILVDQHER